MTVTETEVVEEAEKPEEGHTSNPELAPDVLTQPLFSTSSSSASSSMPPRPKKKTDKQINRELRIKINKMNQSIMRYSFMLDDVLSRCRSLKETVINYTLDNETKDFIQNMKSTQCETPCCTNGYYICKREIQDFTGLKKSKFREESSPNAFELYRDKIAPVCMIPEYEGELPTFRLNASMWWVVKNYTANEVVIKRVD
jgi:hypothetical protein